MNKQEQEILKILYEQNGKTQRELAKSSNCSLGLVNNVLKKLKEDGYIDDQMKTTSKTKKLFQDNSPKSAVILAAGFGMRMVPINLEIPKGLLKVKGETLVERIIHQLHDVNIREIYVVVGFMKESYEYLIDKYNVKLIFSPDYSTKNNLHSLKYALPHLSNTYIIPCDIWCRKNPFNKNELDSWYMVSNSLSEDGLVRVNKKSEILLNTTDEKANKMIGITYLVKSDSQKLKVRLKELSENKKYNQAFWEDALFENGKMTILANIDREEIAYEINTYEELRDLDTNSQNLENKAIKIIEEALDVKSSEIVDIAVLKKGMTNRSFIFTCKGQKYIMRIPGEGSDKLVNRKQEAAAYNVVKNQGICDDIIYINPENGYKITKYVDNARVCDPYNEKEVRACIQKLKEFHKRKFMVKHEFNIWKEIDFYEKLWEGKKSVYQDYEQTKANVFSLRKFIDENRKDYILTHIDANPDNFLISKEDIRLIDWEYAGLQDPDVDIAMFIIYAMYDRKWADKLIDIYYENQCDQITRIKIYCYMAMCGLLWSNWCEYKSNLGVEYGEYSIAQYRYAKDYYKIVQEELQKLEE